MTNTYKISLKNMHINCIIGIHQHERKTPQDIIAHIELTAKQPNDMLGDDYQQVVCYDTLTQNLKNLAEQTKPQLLETLAKHFANLCLQDQRIIATKIILEKPQALDGKTIPTIEYYQEK